MIGQSSPSRSHGKKATKVKDSSEGKTMQKSKPYLPFSKRYSSVFS
jgi:hypothetical protein